MIWRDMRSAAFGGMIWVYPRLDWMELKPLGDGATNRNIFML